MSLKSVGTMAHSCLTPFETGKGSDMEAFTTVCTNIPSGKNLLILTHFGGQPSSSNMAHKPSRLTVSKALVRSKKRI